MDDFIAALLCLPFIIAPLITLIVIVASKLQISHFLPCENGKGLPR